MKKLISIIMIFAMLLSMMSGTVFATDTHNLVITAEDVRVAANNWVTIPLRIEQNPGFQGISFYPVITDANGKQVNWNWVVDDANSNFNFDMNMGTMVVLTADKDCTGIGNLLKVSFFVDEHVALGSYTVSFCLYQNECFNEDRETVTVQLPSVTVEVMDFIYGDVNGDGKVNLQDLLLLRRHMANYDPNTGVSSVSVEAGADANGDGKVTLADILLLRQYLANRDLETGKSPVVLGPSVVEPDHTDPSKPDYWVDDGKNYTYRTYNTVSPSNWNALSYRDANDSDLIGYLNSSFFTYDVKFDDQGEIVPGEFVVQYAAAVGLEDVTAQYAEAWNLPGDRGYAYKITLRDGLMWENGDPIVAGDFVYTMQEQLNPLFQHYRADSYYAGSVNLVGAEAYVNQNQSVWYGARDLYSVYSEDLDSELVFTMGPDLDANCYIRDWVGFPDSYTLEMTIAYLNANYGFAPTAEEIAKIEGKTLAEIKADAELNAIWESALGWWKTAPNEELDFLIANRSYPEASWDEVGLLALDDKTLVIILDSPLELLDDEGNLTYHCAYEFSGLPLVHKVTYEACKQAPVGDSGLWTSTYNTSKETTMSWGTFKLESFQSGKEYVLVRNTNWYGYHLEENEGLYMTDKIVGEIIDEWDTAWQMFLSGEIDSIGLNAPVMSDYRHSSRAYFTPGTTIFFLILNGHMEAIKIREAAEDFDKAAQDLEMLTNTKFHMAMGLSYDKDHFASTISPARSGALGIIGTGYIYDPDTGAQYRETDQAKQVLCDFYGVDTSKFATLDDAVDSITGYDPKQAKVLFGEAFEEGIEAGYITDANNDGICDQTIRIEYAMSAGVNDFMTKTINYLNEKIAEVTTGTPFEGKIEFYMSAPYGDRWSTVIREGMSDTVLGGWSGSTLNPFSLTDLYTNPSRQYDAAWYDATKVELTINVPVAGENKDVTLTLKQWSDCLNGTTVEVDGVAYNYGSGRADVEIRLNILAAVEGKILESYNYLPMLQDGSWSMLSYKLDYITDEYNLFVGFGGLKYASYNFTDEEWAEFVAANNNDLSEEYKKSEDSDPYGAGYDGSEVTITFYHTMGSSLSDVLNIYIEEFNQLYPNIHIQHKQVGGYDDVRDQIKTELTVGNHPSIAYCYPDHVALYNIPGAVVALDNLIASEIQVTRADGTTEILGLTDAQIADFIGGFYNEGKQFGDGLMYSMPMSKSTEVLYYNKTFFEENGLQVPTTWEEMEALCARILEIDSDCIPLGYDSESNWFITMAEQYGNPYTSASGEEHFLFDNDANKEFVKMLRDWYQKGYVTTQDIYGAYTSSLFVSATGTNSYMSIASSAGASHQRPSKTADGYPFEVGIATIPQVNPDAPKVISQGPSLCIFKSENPQEVIASWLFVKFLTTNTDFQAEFSMASGYMPVLKSVAQNEVYARFLANADGGDFISALSAKVCLEQDEAYFTPPAFHGSSVARDYVDLLMESALTSNANGDVDAMLDELFANVIQHCKNYVGETSNPNNPNAGLEDARAYLTAFYSEVEGTIARRDFSMLASVLIDGVTFPIIWTTDTPDFVAIGAVENNVVKIDIVEEPSEPVFFKLIGTLIDDEGNVASVIVSRYIEAKKDTGVDFVASPVAGTAYKYAVQQNNLGQTLYFTGEMSGYYLGTSENPAEGVNVFVEIVEGGYRLYFMKGTVKTYIDVVPRGVDYPGKVDIILTENPSCFYQWDAERGTFITEVEGNTWYIGCYSTYNTMSASNTSYIENVEVIGNTQFPAGFCTVEGFEDPVLAWGVIGGICGTMWDTDIPMTQINETTWESAPLELHAGEEFKVRQGACWDINFGFEYNGQNFVVENDGTYIVRLVWCGGQNGTVTLISVN